jgi:hypothetical protein
MDMKRRLFVVGAAVLPLSGCSTLRAVWHYDKLGDIRSTLVEYLPKDYLAMIAGDLRFLDDTYLEVSRVLDRDPDVTLLDILSLALGSPAGFTMVGNAYGNIRAAVVEYSRVSNTPIPSSLIVFNADVSPAYREIQLAVAGNDRLKKGALIAQMLKPLVILL